MRTLHLVVLLAVFAILLPRFMRGLFHFYRKLGGLVLEDENHPETRMSDESEDCVLIANWTNVDPSEYHYISRHCDNLYAAVAILDLPITSDLIYLVSRGAHGSVKVMFDREIDKAVASVAVDVLYQSPYTLDEAKVCLLQRVKGKNGVGLFIPETSTHGPPRRSYPFGVTIRLPAPSSKDRLHVNGLETKMENFTHIIGNLEDLVRFKSLSLRGDWFLVNSVFAEAVDVVSSNGSIQGNFSITNSLALRTSNAPIDVNVAVTNDASDHASEVDIRTSNGPITSNLTLLSSADNHTGGKFKVTVATSNGPVNITTTGAPVGSILNLEGHTSNAPANARVHETYEGTFFLRSSAATVDYDDTIEDPAGEGRKRIVYSNEVSRKPAYTEGTVRWLPTEQKELGSIVLTTSDSPVHLAL